MPVGYHITRASKVNLKKILLRCGFKQEIRTQGVLVSFKILISWVNKKSIFQIFLIKMSDLYVFF